MSNLPKEISDFMEKWDIRSDELWQVHGSTHVIKHKALERAAAKAGIIWDRPAIIEQSAERNIAVICVFGKLGERTEWSIGEASPSNYRVTGKMAAYPYAMAEKRGKDRCILKLLNAHGDIYSDEEADDFKRPRQSMPDGFDEAEQIPAEHTIPRVDGIQVLTVDAQRPIFSELERELLNCSSVEELKRWKVSAKSRASRLSDHWRTELNNRYLTYLRTLEKRDADEYIERMTANG
jgi:hypothetical protein